LLTFHAKAGESSSFSKRLACSFFEIWRKNLAMTAPPSASCRSKMRMR
jgi:hypothetical protein